MDKCSICEEYKEKGYTCDDCDAFICDLCAEEHIFDTGHSTDDIGYVCKKCLTKEG